MKKQGMINQFFSKTLVIATMISLVLPFSLMANRASAATNLVKQGSFEADLYNYWGVWHGGDSNRTLNFYREYQSAYGQGSYSAAIEAVGEPVARTEAGLVGAANNTVVVNPGRKYLLKYFVKSTKPSTYSVYLENSTSYQPITITTEQNANGEWTEQAVLFAPTVDTQTNALLVFALGDLPNGAVVNIDGISLIEFNPVLVTPQINGVIGETNKILKFNDLSYFTSQDVEIELPYFEPATRQSTIKRFNPLKITATEAYFGFPRGTFGGAAKVFIKGNQIGQFDYNVLPRVNEFSPSLVRAGEELTLTLSGINPNPDASFIVVKMISGDGKQFDRWLKPQNIDSQLSLATVKLPVGVISGSMFMQTSYTNMAGKSMENRTVLIPYKVIPVITGVEWSNRGYEQVGDNLKIRGRGIGNTPTVNFYDTNGKLIVGRRAKLISSTDKEEVIEVQTPVSGNKLNLTVRNADGQESDRSAGIYYSARPKLVSIASANKRIYEGSGENIAAARIGEIITLNAEGFAASSSETRIEFQGYGQRFVADLAPEQLASGSRTIKLTVPDGVQTGFVNIISNGERSNGVPLEIIPKVMSVSPTELAPGIPFVITAKGVGGNKNLVKIYLNLVNRETVEVFANEVTVNPTETIISAIAPNNLSASYSSLNLQYDRWTDNAQVVMNVKPVIYEASMNLDDRTLTIKGYGFSLTPAENVMTYKYADEAHTVIQPKVQLVSVVPTEEGQEIKVKMLDNYHYGYVSVKVGNNLSNEVNFGPISVRKVVRRVEMVESINQVKGVLYISGYNFGAEGDVKVGDVWATTISRTEFFVVAYVEPSQLYGVPVYVTKR